MKNKNSFLFREVFKNEKEFYDWYEKNDGKIGLYERFYFLVEENNTIYASILEYLEALEEG